MKRIGLILLMGFIAFFQNGCEALEEVIKSQEGCMLKDARNYNSAALFPCTSDCIGEKTGNNCCCEEIIYGCMDESAPNYSSTANAPCVEEVSGVDTPNACCTESITGCMDQGANNYEPLSTVSDEAQCTYDDYGCMNSSACNYNSSATKDCSGETPVDATSQNDDCCDLSANSVCYLDLNNNGYWEEADSTSAGLPTCNCAELGVGWVTGDDVAANMEVQGCTQPTVDGVACIEYNPYANVDNGGCCLTELTDEELANPEIALVGVYNMELNMGMLDENGDCVADTMMNFDDYGPTINQVILGAGGGFNHHEEYHDSFSSRPEWEFRAPGIDSDMACEELADSLGADYWFCRNWGVGDDFATCDDFYDKQGCESGGPECRWETNFCHPAFSGMPCNDINFAPDFANDPQSECEWRDDCEWDENGDNGNGACFTPVWEPWMECMYLDEYECEMDWNDDGINHCEVPAFDPSELDCLDDCECMLDIPEDGEATEEDMCTFSNCMKDNVCWSDCDYDLQDEFDMFGWISYMCGAPAECEEMMMDEEDCEDLDGDGYCDDDDSFDCLEDCEGILDPDDDPIAFCEWAVANLETACNADCYVDAEEIISGAIDVCTNCLNEDNCHVVSFDFEDLADGPPACMEDCDMGTSGDEEDMTIFCDSVPNSGDACVEDCEEDTQNKLLCLDYICAGCDEFDCSEMDSFGNNEFQSKDDLFYVIRKIVKKSQNQNQLSRGGDCPDGEIEDCNGDCIYEDWVGDDWCDDSLNCSDFDYDGGDCEGGNDEWDPDDVSCVPNLGTYPCFGYDENECMSADCMWHGGDIDEEGVCSPPIGNSLGVCQEITDESDCNAKVGECHWMMEGPNGEPGGCAPTPPDCFSKNNVDDCEDSPNCEWAMPDWIDPWADGACFKDDHCKSDPNLNNNEDACNADPGCEWVWDGPDSGCWEAMMEGEGGSFCECMLPFTRISCETAGGSWVLPPWAMEGDEWAEKECMMPMTEQDCFHEFVDDNPCAEDHGGGNEKTSWNAATHTCTKSFGFSEAGIWSINTDGDFCIEWDNDDDTDPDCNTLLTPDECNCFDCIWDGQMGICNDYDDGGNGRVSNHALNKKYENMVEELSNNNNGECFEYEMDGANIHILIEMDDEFGDGYCEEIILKPATSGS
jgi:hypothetical protein